MQDDATKLIRSGTVWLDDSGSPIQAHGGGILVWDGVYYWYGEDKRLGNFNRTGVSCYSSRDLLHWRHEGVVLPKAHMPAAFRDEGICERPKVLRCPATGKFVMWMHLDDQAYLVAQAGVAIADAPTGPFEFVRGFRPINFPYPLEGEDRCREHELGGTYRDMTLFQDDDGQAYAFYSSESNWTMYICRLRPDYLGSVEPAVQGETWQRVLVKQKREAPAPFKFGGRYYLITSGCTGWAPNAADVAVADHVLGPYTQLGNPCSGPGAEATFESQSTFVMANPFKPSGHFIFMADRWKKDELHDSRYVWLPFAMDYAGRFKLEYRDAWDPRA